MQQCTAVPDGMLSADRITAILNSMMREIEGVTLDYFALSYGKQKTETTLCTLFRARVFLVEMNGIEAESDGYGTTTTTTTTTLRMYEYCNLLRHIITKSPTITVQHAPHQLSISEPLSPVLDVFYTPSSTKHTFSQRWDEI